MFVPSIEVDKSATRDLRGREVLLWSGRKFFRLSVSTIVLDTSIVGFNLAYPFD